MFSQQIKQSVSQLVLIIIIVNILVQLIDQGSKIVPSGQPG